MTATNNTRCLAISGGVGGAKLALGLSHVLPPGDLTIVANTGDDFSHLGFTICPDLDTVMYTLADMNNKDLGWGQAEESWNFLDALKRLGEDSWFQIGDRDLATHVIRSRELGLGKTLSQVTTQLSRDLNVEHPLVPMTDDSVSTIVCTRNGEELAFQHYFVRDRCAPVVSAFKFTGIERARPSPEFLAALGSARLELIVICPSNPFVSVDPVLKVPGVIEAIRTSNVPVIAVSPIVGGQAIKGPAAKMMRELGMPQTAAAVARHYVEQYPDIIRGFIIDDADRELRGQIEALGLSTTVTNTVMVTLQDRIDLARHILDRT